METKVKTRREKPVKIIKEETDPMALRVSLGGKTNLGYYLVYRGDNPYKILEMLEDATEAFKQYLKENN